MEKGAEAILKGLNREQREAVECTQGPSLIVAGVLILFAIVFTITVVNLLISKKTSIR